MSQPPPWDAFGQQDPRQHQGQPQQPYGRQPPPPGPPRKVPGRRHPVRTALLIAGGVFLAVIVIAAVAAVAKHPAPAAGTGPSSAAAATPAATPAAAKSTTAAPKLTYLVTGTPGAADVTYGAEGSSASGKVPMRVTRKLGHAGYYSVQAQLNGGGHVTVEILIGGKVVSRGTASGGYNIASAEIVRDPLTGEWQDVQQ